IFSYADRPKCRRCGEPVCPACGQCHDCAEDCERYDDEIEEGESDLERDRRWRFDFETAITTTRNHSVFRSGWHNVSQAHLPGGSPHLGLQLTVLLNLNRQLPRSRRGLSGENRTRTVEEIMKCHSSLLVKHSPQTNWGSIRYPVGNTNGRPTLVLFLSSSEPLEILRNSLFSVVLKLSRRGLLSRVEARQALRRLSSTLRQFRSWLRAETDSNSLLTRLAVSHRQLTV